MPRIDGIAYLDIYLGKVHVLGISLRSVFARILHCNALATAGIDILIYHDNPAIVFCGKNGITARLDVYAPMKLRL